MCGNVVINLLNSVLRPLTFSILLLSTLGSQPINIVLCQLFFSLVFGLSFLLIYFGIHVDTFLTTFWDLFTTRDHTIVIFDFNSFLLCYLITHSYSLIIPIIIFSFQRIIVIFSKIYFRIHYIFYGLRIHVFIKYIGIYITFRL